MIRRRLAAGFAVVFGLLLLPTPAQAHPLGNFTTNQYAGLRVSSAGVAVDYVLDLAELPAYQAKNDDIDTDHDGTPSPAEQAAYATRTCAAVAAADTVTVAGHPRPLSARPGRLTFPPGAGGLTTLRLECVLHADADADLAAQTTVGFTSGMYADRVGWREITAVGDRYTLVASDVPATSVSKLLSAYPPGVAGLDVRTAALTVRPGGPAAAPPPFVVGGGNQARDVDRFTNWFTDLVGRPQLTLGVGLLAFLIALVLGGAHAVAPGHGKTIMAAYLVGSRGRLGQALTVAGTVAATHTAGVLVLGVLLATSLQLAPDLMYAWLRLASGVLVAAVGAHLLRKAVRRLRSRPVVLPHEHVAHAAPAAVPGAGLHGPADHSPADHTHPHDPSIPHPHDPHLHPHDHGELQSPDHAHAHVSHPHDHGELQSPDHAHAHVSHPHPHDHAHDSHLHSHDHSDLHSLDHNHPHDHSDQHSLDHNHPHDHSDQHSQNHHAHDSHLHPHDHSNLHSLEHNHPHDHSDLQSPDHAHDPHLHPHETTDLQRLDHEPHLLPHDHGDPSSHDHDHDHAHPHPRELVAVGHAAPASADRASLAAAGHTHDPAPALSPGHAEQHTHTHGGRPHTHYLPAPDEPLNLRTLLAMGFAGGLSPSPSAVVVLLGAAALGRAWYGVLLVTAYGIGLAATLIGIGFALAHWGERLRRANSHRWTNLLTHRLPAATATVILLVGLGMVALATASLLST